MNLGGFFVLLGLLGVAAASWPWGGVPILILLALIALRS